MGRIADAIDQIEDELQRLEGKYSDLEEAHTKLQEECGELEVLVEKQREIIEQYNAMEDYLEEYHPGVVTAFEVAQRMET